MKHFFNKKRYKRKGEQGYILLLTLLVISILLAVGFGIYAISIRDLVLSSFLRDSEKALAAADRGVECALYWDRAPTAANPQLGITYTIFATSSTYLPPPNSANATCHSGAVNLQLNSVPTTGWLVTSIATAATTTLRLNFSDGTCVDLLVAKAGNDSTAFIADGYNSCSAASPRRTQREIAVFTNI